MIHTQKKKIAPKVIPTIGATYVGSRSCTFLTMTHNFYCLVTDSSWASV